MDPVVEQRRSSRAYDILLLGATGYTGSLTAEHVAQHLPTDLKWAIAGRSRSKLDALAKKLKDINPERSQPEIEVLSFDDQAQLDSVVKNSKVCISAVLYWQVGEAVLKSCVENETDYIDMAGDIPLLRTFIDAYHEKAVNSHVALIHLCGAFAAPQDLLTWVTARELAQKASLKTREVVLSTVELELEPSGGTVSSILAESTHDPRIIVEASQPWALSPVKGSKISTSTNFLGLRRDPTLGLLSASSVGAVANRALVHRTWGLFEQAGHGYGPNFQYNEYNKVSSPIAGFFRLLSTAILSAALRLRISRVIMSWFYPKPGEGPDVEKTRHSRMKLEAVAIADVSDAKEAPRAYASFSYPSGPYHATALFLAHGAASLLYDRSLEGEVSGGCLTPAFLGRDLWRRVQAAGATVRVNLVPL